MQAQKEKKEQLLFTIEDIKKEHALLSDVIQKANAKIVSLTEEVRWADGASTFVCGWSKHTC